MLVLGLRVREPEVAEQHLGAMLARVDDHPTLVPSQNGVAPRASLLDRARLVCGARDTYRQPSRRAREPEAELAALRVVALDIWRPERGKAGACGDRVEDGPGRRDLDAADDVSRHLNPFLEAEEPGWLGSVLKVLSN